MYQPNQLPIEDALKNEFAGILNALVRNNTITQPDGQNIYMHLEANVQTFAMNIRQRYQNVTLVQEIITNEARAIIQNVLASRQQQINPMGVQPMMQPIMQQQPMMQPMMQPMGMPQNLAMQQFHQPIQLMNQQFHQPQPGTPGSYLERNVQQNQVPNMNQQPAHTEKRNVVIQYIDKSSIHADDADNIASSTDPNQIYTFRDDPEYLKYSTKSHHSGNIVDVLSKRTIIDKNTLEECEYINVDCRILEPCVGYVVDKFVNSNPALTKFDKYIINIDYGIFVLKNHRFVANPNIIDTTVFNNPDYSGLDAIRRFSGDVYGIVRNNAAVIESLIIHEFNDLIKRRLVTEEDAHDPIKVDNFDDVVSLLDNTKVRNIRASHHQNFNREVIQLFKVAVNRVIMKDTQFGYYQTERICGELIASPKFVIRDNGLYERESDFNTPEMLSAIGLRYTAFGVRNSIVIANFVPGDLDNDLFHTKIMTFDQSCDSNQLIYLINNVWRHESKTILIQSADKFIIKNGITLNGTPFLFKEKYEPDYGL